MRSAIIIISFTRLFLSYVQTLLLLVRKIFTSPLIFFFFFLVSFFHVIVRISEYELRFDTSPHSISKSTRSVDRRMVINKLRSLYAEIFTCPPFADSCREDVTSSNNGGPVVNVDAYNTEHVSLSVRSFSIN